MKDQIAVTIPSCRSCGGHDALRWVTRVQRHGKVVAERWACLRCGMLVVADPERRLAQLVITALFARVPAFWWRRSRAQAEPRQAA